MEFRLRSILPSAGLMLLLAPALVPGSAAAVTITGTTITTFAESVGPTGSTTDAKGPVGSGSLLSSVVDPTGSLRDFSGPAYADAGQSVGGFAAVGAEGAYADGSARHTLTATTTWEQTASITGGSAEALSVLLKITPGQLALIDFAGLAATDPERMMASYDIALDVNGTTVFDSGALLEGGLVSHVLTETGTSLGASFFQDAAFPNNVFGYDFGALLTSVSIGTFNPGENLTITYTMTVNVDTPGFETGGAALIGDPLDLSAGNAVEITLVPEPGLALLGLVALLAAARARRC